MEQDLKTEVRTLIEEVDKTHSYSMSKIYGLYNRVFEKDEKPQSCASCLIRKVNELRTWYSNANEEYAEMPTEEQTNNSIDMSREVCRYEEKLAKKDRKKNNTMAAPKGNKFYKKREKDGRELEYKMPEDFTKEAYKYFEWCDKNPWKKKDFIKSGDSAGKLVTIPTNRPYTIEGLCNYMGISVKTFYNYEERKDYLQVVTHVREIIRQNQIEGACVGAYNSNIVAIL